MYRFASIYCKLAYFLSFLGILGAPVFFGFQIVRLNLTLPAYPDPVPAQRFEELEDRFRSQIQELDASLLRVLGVGGDKISVLAAAEFEPPASFASARRLRSTIDGLQEELGALRQEILELQAQSILPVVAQLSRQQGGADSTNRPKAVLRSVELPVGIFGVESIPNLQTLAEQLRQSADGFKVVGIEATDAANKQRLEDAARTASNLATVFFEQARQRSEAIRTDELTLGELIAEDSSIPLSARRDRVAASMERWLSYFSDAVEQGWAVDDTLRDARQLVDGYLTAGIKVSEARSEIRLAQVFLAVQCLLWMFAAFLIGVGSDIVRAIIDGSTWLAHIGGSVTQVGTDS
jgi:hypothetical protein